MANGTQTQSAGGSLSDLLTAAKNIVLAINALAQNYLNVQGSINFAGITAPTVVKASSGRIARVSVIVAGSSTGFIYDGASLSATTKPLYVIPMAVGTEPYEVNMPTSFGLLVVPGTGMTVSGSCS
jgi:hypothetical protein